MHTRSTPSGHHHFIDLTLKHVPPDEHCPFKSTDVRIRRFIEGLTDRGHLLQEAP